MGNDITREELNAFTSAHEKSASALEKIACQLELITDKTDTLVAKLENGLPQTIVDAIISNYNVTQKETHETLKRIEDFSTKNIEKIPETVNSIITNSDIAQDIKHVKWFVTIVGLLSICVSLVVRAVDTKMTHNADATNLSIAERQIISHITALENEIKSQK